MIPDEREWQAQERAMKMERDGIDVAEADGLSAGYLSIARALRQPLEAQLPADFATRVATLAAQQSPGQLPESGFEQALLLALGVIMGVSALVAAIIYGAGWLAPLGSALAHLGKPNLAWSVAVLACLAFSWFGDLLRRHMASTDHHLA